MTDELLIKFLLKEANEEENTEIVEWLSADPANRDKYIQLEKIWDASKKLALASDIDENQAWLKFKAKATPAQTAVIRPLRQPYPWLKIAAVFIAIFGAWMAYSLFNPKYTALIAGNQVVTEQLPDGSEIILNKNSEISYARNFKEHRSIRLTKGNVFFNVAPDKARPFVIDADKVSVTVVGTSFNVKHLQDETEVIVETGIVKVRLGAEEIVLVKGEKALIKGSSKKLIKEKNTELLYNYYRSKVFIANNTPLILLIDALNEGYNADIVLDPTLKTEKIFITLKQDKPLDYNLKLIADAVAGLKITRNGTQIFLSNVK
ncbi:FecR family protein [Pedobacter metabolipauper]|uniref:FecR family protein n=1 Tax=Pedobacter metabolipauper TaxID=425513 RepID=A0A4R6T2V2_9SPHI|nr:FecR domain-containing protein [Pedobacter metabolipauper]TDQ12058.1 FecR family protein [Pedobacter metabolipauper]